MSEKLWGGRFSKSTDEMINDFQASITFDKRLYQEDILGSIAHAQMLKKCKILSSEDADKIIRGLKQILSEIEKGEFDFQLSLEDIHMNIEQRLTYLIGEAGKKLHTARSRNDQVALDMHLFVRRQTILVLELIINLQKALVDVAQAHADVIMPGYTHLQRAQPILFAHHLLAYFSMFSRDFTRFLGVYARADIMPLGAGALAGTTFPIDRAETARLLQFSTLYTNSLDAVSDRDYNLEFLAAGSILMVHLSRLSEEIILWCSREFAFIELDDAHSTGSSMMPQKKNPDVPELVRGKTGRVTGHLMALLTTVKALPLAYNKDLQEDKEGLFDAVDTIQFSLTVYEKVLRGMKVKKENMEKAVREDFSNATDLADYLVKKGVPFRTAHAIAGSAVKICIEKKIFLLDLPLNEYKKLSPFFADDLYEALNPKNCVKNRKSYGATSYTEVNRQFKIASEVLHNEEVALKNQVAKLKTLKDNLYE